MASGPQAFYCLWQDKEIRERLFKLLSKEDICNIRLASSAGCNLVTKRLFLRTHLTFKANTFTRQSKIEALSRIGHHIEHLTFYFPHSDATFLPPLVHPETGREISFLYAPHTSMASVFERPKFANSSLGEILTLQYPPLFHAASNVPSFINAMKHMRNMRHITIKTPGQDPQERYRRDIVDYALISLRISLERAPLPKLAKLTLASVHPSAFIYLRHTPGGFGCLPSAGRRWRQIRKLAVSVEAWDFYGPAGPGLDHLKLIDDFVRSFAAQLDKFAFAWLGRYKGPCPLALAADPLFAPPRSTQKLFHEVTSPMSPLPPAPPRAPVTFRRVRHLAVRNATMSAQQVADLVASHRHCAREFDFENVVLIHGDSWDDALAPLTTHGSRSGRWTRYSSATISEVGGSISRPATAAKAEMILPEDLPTQSAAVAAVSEELLHLDINLFRDQDEEDDDGDSGIGAEEDESQDGDEEDIYLPSDVEAARQASLAFPNKLKKRRVTKRHRKRKESHQRREEDEAAAVTAEAFDSAKQKSERRRHHHHHHHRRERSEDTSSPNSPEKQQPSPLHRRFWQKKPKDSSVGECPQVSSSSPSASASASVSASASSAFSTPSHSRQPSNESMYRRPQAPPQLTIPHLSPSRGRLFGEVDNHNNSQNIYSPATPPSSSSSPSPYASSRRLLFGEITPLGSGSEPDLSHSPIDEETEEDSVAGDYFRPLTPPTPRTPLVPHSAQPLPLLPSAMPRSSPSSRYSNSRNSNDTAATPMFMMSMMNRKMKNQHHDMNMGMGMGMGVEISAPILDTKPSMPALLQPTVYDPTADLCSEISAVQRDLEAEEAQRRVAFQDADAQVSALRRAKELVLSRLAGRGEPFNQGGVAPAITRKDSNSSRGTGNSGGGGGGSNSNFLSSARFREGLFGRNNNNSVVSTAMTVDQRSMDVPILFSRG
ncbi:hypothetical protein SLS62_011287 [Diatrype stigma]|uniref:Uncharacterized protein n=1 Tax=Diatrype stigma TaxID=117547 RepID=A0AAN9U3R3_9PEZI